MLSNKNLDPDKKDDLLRIIVSNAKKLQFLTDNLLDVARIDGQLLTLNLEEFDLMESVRDLLRRVGKSNQGEKYQFSFKE
jgi:K+-sensing histidine kinase KdpD